VVLFGSRARGEAAPDSDMDVLVLTARPVTREERHRVTGALSPLGREIGVMFSTLVVDEESWSRGMHRVLPIHAEIERDGVAA
jgi:predicted nucleotidyltransferase